MQGMTWPGSILGTALLLGVLASYFYPWIAGLLLSSWRREKPARESASGELPPVTLLRPVKAGVPALREKLEALAGAMRPGDQLVLGADEGSEEMSACNGLRLAHPGREISAVSCRPGAALNPKISKLVQMAPHARHDRWILSDSETLIYAAWLDSFRREWLAGGADALTAGYRFLNLGTWPQRLDAAATLLTLWPGLAVRRCFGRLDFTLGACTGLRRQDVEAVGGWAAFGDFLAEDNRLGSALAKAGRTIRLSTEVATLDSDPLTWRDYWRHQRRVAVTYRVCNPAGFAAMICTNGFVASVLPTVYAASWVVCAAMSQVIRWWMFRDLAKQLRFPIAWLFPVMLVASGVEIACWCAAWFDRRVWWAGRRWRVSRAGRLTPEA